MERPCISRRSPLAISTLLFTLLNPSAAIPYTPSSLFLAPQYNDSLAYLLRPSSSLEGKVELLSLNFSSSLDTNDTSFQTLLSEAPFQSTEQNSTYTPVIDDQGIITVYAGNCQNSTDKNTVWQFHPDNSSSIGNGSWSQLPVIPDEKTNPKYLAAGFTFSSNSTSESAVYAFGGMCPLPNSTDETWISAANYSQSMTLLNPESGKSSEYYATTTGNRAPPVAEAGIAIVPLSATTFKQERQQDFLFIGGHTRQAFLNMSQLALFSVPQGSWSFVAVNSEATPKTELAVRDQSVEPRSGHAAVLSNDGTKIFVIGGWVGNTSIPADPQVAVLEVGENYGGSGSWSWKIPTSNGAKNIDHAGIFGHSAIMLPGDILMIAGGYTIPKLISKRSTFIAQANPNVYLYNSTSGNWITSYTNPTAHKSTSSDASGLSSRQKIGLGVGLGLGIPFLIIIALLAKQYHRRHGFKSKRDSQLRELALGAERAHFWGRGDVLDETSARTSRTSEKTDPVSTYPWSGNRNHTSRPPWNDQKDGLAEMTGLLANASPNINNPSESRPPSQTRPWSGYRRSEVLSDIHPIDEREEDEAIVRERLMATIPTSTGENPEFLGQEDPFTQLDASFGTPRTTIFGVGLGPFYSRRKDIGADNDGAVSPVKSERTSTNLSDSSSFSFASAQQTGQVMQARAVYIERPVSWSSSGRQSLEQLATGSYRLSRETAYSDLDGVPPSESSYSADTFSTAQTTISDRLAEATSLLSEPDATRPQESLPSSPSKLPPSAKPRPGMMQTMRRALTINRRSDSQTDPDETAEVASGIDHRSTIIGSPPRSTKSGASTPRRAVSASAELFRRRREARDKRAFDPVSNERHTRDDLFLGAPGYLGDDDTCNVDEIAEDCDIEDSNESSSVQLTYTFPREKLRVVNATKGDMDNLSEGSINRTLSGTTVLRRVSS
ncbi:hypothetical protein N7495_006021 [Penicillium taxi]|uniref:uncharacterized protein n=1 Tax=Penicillium taxi TaxID=168475 RepID=UPI002545396E|nr:uncharacterized protein N7495_006021 [Penicillium taxi]KAJ5894330.1 hypothetical protein N7495_006021 [Penicillium taxi]